MIIVLAFFLIGLNGFLISDNTNEFYHFEGISLKEIGNSVRWVGITDEGNWFVLYGDEHSMRGKVIKDSNLVAVTYSEIVTEPEPIKESKTEITMIVSKPLPVELRRDFHVSVRVYDAAENPKGNLNQNWGYLSDVMINVNIVNQDGTVVETFNGTTDGFGRYSGGFNIPWNFPIGKYQVIVNGSFEDSVDTQNFTLHVIHPAPVN